MLDKFAKPPAFLRKEAKDKYCSIAGSLSAEGKWKTGDEVALSALVTNYQHWIDAEKLIKSNGDMCFTTESGYRQQIPEISIANNAMKLMLTFIKEFGLTPKERAKLQEMLFSENDEELENMVIK